MEHSIHVKGKSASRDRRMPGGGEWCVRVGVGVHTSCGCWWVGGLRPRRRWHEGLLHEGGRVQECTRPGESASCIPGFQACNTGHKAGLWQKCFGECAKSDHALLGAEERMAGTALGAHAACGVLGTAHQRAQAKLLTAQGKDAQAGASMASTGACRRSWQCRP